MNKRIENLFEQALDAAVPETWTRLDMDQVKRLRDKFAELIVRECVKEMGRYEFIDVAMCEVKEHFGIEE